MSEIPPPPPPPGGQPPSGPQPYQPPAPAPSPYPIPGAASPPPPPGFGSTPFGSGGPSFQSFQPTTPTRSKKALWSMILGIVGAVLCFVIVPALVALILGILALREIGRSNGERTGKGMAIAGVVLGALGIVAGAAFIAIVVNEVAGTTDIRDVEVGDCVELPDDGEEISRIETFECTEPHGAEVVSVGELGEEGDEFPGASDVVDQIGEACIADFNDYVGKDFFESDFDLFPITPTEQTWDDDRTYVCLAFDPDGELTESIEGSGR